jgi:hypothetical protein
LVIAETIGCGVTVRVKVTDASFRLTVKTEDIVELTWPPRAVNLTLVAPDWTTAGAGTTTDVLSLATVRVKPPGGAAAVRNTVQVLAVPGAMTPGAQLKADRITFKAAGWMVSAKDRVTPADVTEIAAVWTLATWVVVTVKLVLVLLAGMVTWTGDAA